MLKPIAVLLLVTSACRADRPAPANETAPATPRATHGTNEAAPAATATPSTDEMRARFGPEAGEELAGAFESIGALMNAMKQAARGAADAEAEPCEAAYASHVAAIAVAQNATLPGGRTPPSRELLPRARFLQVCKALPPAFWPCARFDRQVDAESGCRAREQSAGEDVRNQLALLRQ